MKKTISNLISLIGIFVSIITYVTIYSIMLDAHPSAKGFAELFTIMSAVFFIINGLSLTTVLKKIKKLTRNIVLILYCLIGIIPLSIENYHNAITLGIISIITILISINLMPKASINQSIIISGVLLVLNSAWGWLIIGM